MKKDELKQPFFVKLLESQRKLDEKTQIFTSKLFDEIPQTQKYPSDNDEV